MNDRLVNLIVFLIEVGIGLACGAIAAAFILPLAYTERGYFAIGAEWLIIIVVAYAGFSATNKYIFDSVERS
jgi:hypothetical protein